MFDEIVISGIAGRYPASDTIDDLRNNLFDNKDLVIEDQTRWPTGLYNLPRRQGNISDINRFDAQFFGIHGKQVNAMDPQIRILLEKTYEAVLDSGQILQRLTAEFTTTNINVYTKLYVISTWVYIKTQTLCLIPHGELFQ